MSTAYPTWVTEFDRSALLTERQRLLDRRFAGPWTRADEARLTWVRWQLDRLDDQRRTA